MPDDGQRAPTPGLCYPLGEPPATGEAKEVAPGVLWLRMPLPYALEHINAWAIADEDERGPGWAIVDTGTSTPAVAAAWNATLAPDGPLRRTSRGPRVTRVIATHMHPDHIGMAGWLTRHHGCRLWMSRLEYLTCRTLAADTGREAPEDAIRFYRESGWSESALHGYRARFGSFGRFLYALPDSYERISEGQTLRIAAHDWRTVIGQGHSPEHVCLLCEELGLLISGDQVLPRISSNVSVFPTEPNANPLDDWLGSLERLRATLSGDLLVLPAHGEPFRGLHARLDKMSAGHADALERLRGRLAEPRRVVDVFGALFARPIDSDGIQLGMATGEALAHLNYLLLRGEITRQRDTQGVARYVLAR